MRDWFREWGRYQIKATMRDHARRVGGIGARTVRWNVGPFAAWRLCVRILCHSLSASVLVEGVEDGKGAGVEDVEGGKDVEDVRRGWVRRRKISRQGAKLESERFVGM